MNEAHLHLVVNHFPIIFPVVGILILVVGLISKSEAVKRTAYMIFIIGALAAIAAMVTGEDAEEIVEKINGVGESFIETHEEDAELFSILNYILGGISLIGLWASFKQKKSSYILNIVTLVFAAVVLFFGSQTGTSGGEIRHSEIRGDDGKPVNRDIEKSEND